MSTNEVDVVKLFKDLSPAQARKLAAKIGEALPILRDEVVSEETRIDIGAEIREAIRIGEGISEGLSMEVNKAVAEARQKDALKEADEIRESLAGEMIELFKEPTKNAARIAKLFFLASAIGRDAISAVHFCLLHDSSGLTFAYN